MFKSVLIAEDQEFVNISLRKAFEDLGIREPGSAYYCDEALKKIKIGIRTGRPYELLITDLSFEEDHCVQELSDGMELIAAARQAQPDLKVLVFSAEDKPAVIERLFAVLGINGYVRKSRGDSQKLKDAIESIYKGSRYFPSDIRQAIKQKNAYAFNEFEILIIRLLSQGKTQKEIPCYLQENKIYPQSLSSVEKHLNNIKTVLGFSNNEQLIAYCKDMGII
ncbi:response regulator transcription factor [Hufsiella ginkgonis]|uniref:Response regulator n=1 Tax=Hufsiella ginkgonis TaxID=2695274 RepID=A0A7K1XTF1_9SPHI|nr:response regulator transcription factor [Hufsiella ginkgonis]MXV14285.1 response regulator [Hufsiella ginkgonis]